MSSDSPRGPVAAARIVRCLPEKRLLCYLLVLEDAPHDREQFGGDRGMTGKAIQDLVGRVMIDGDFLAELVRDPDATLAGYELTAEERAIILQALGRGVHGSEQERAHALQSVMLKRWAT